MIAETGMLATIAIVLAAVAFIIKSLEFENETAFKALNFLSAILFSIVFYWESATIAMYAAILWAIVSVLFILRGSTRHAPLRGWDEDIQPPQAKEKKKRKPREKKPDEPESGSTSSDGTTPIWPWS